MFFSATSLSVLALLVSCITAAPTPEVAHAIQLLQRDGLATVYSSCTTPNTVALTFDDGPYIYETDISKTLSDSGVKGTFFINGNNWDCIYDDRQINSMRTTFAAGHMFGSHTWSHKDLTTLSWDEIHDEMWRVELAMSRILGVTPAFMRPPYGSYNDQVRSASFIRNQSMVLWDFDSGDSTGSSPQQSEQAYVQVISQHLDNLLPLNHETYNTTASTVLPYAIQQLKTAGYQFATVAECLGMDPYFTIGTPGTKDSSWDCNN